MTKPLFAIALALVALPAAALADPNDATQTTAPLPAQRQAISSQRQAFFQKEMQMHQQLRAQMLDALSPDHRTAVADAIGQMVIAASPDPAATAKQIDAVLSPSEQQRILALHGTFVSQSQALMQQMGQQMQNQGASSHGPWASSPHMTMPPGANDAGSVLLMVLAHRPPMMGMMPGMHGMGPGMHGMGPNGPQPGGPPPGGPPPPP